MDLQTRKINFIQEFLKLQNEELIIRLENMLKGNKSVKQPVPMSIEEFNARIDQSLEDSANDRVIHVDDLIAEIKKWE